MPRILLVDDEPLVARALGRLLRRHGYEVETAASGQEALGRLGDYRADLVVSDHRMPGMSGVDLLSRVGERWPLTARLLVSGCDDVEELVASAGPGCGFLRKPWDERALVAHVASLLAVRSPASLVAP
jgi:DNA-binding response OmpR family regulator